MWIDIAEDRTDSALEDLIEAHEAIESIRPAVGHEQPIDADGQTGVAEQQHGSRLSKHPRRPAPGCAGR